MDATADINPVLKLVTERIQARSRSSRSEYLRRLDLAAIEKIKSQRHTCLPYSNLAHGLAACTAENKSSCVKEGTPNIGIISSYNDLVSGHQPFERFPAVIKEEIAAAGGTAQFAGGLPAMCDGITQGLPSMELSLFSRDLIAMSTAIALSHNMFDGILGLGVCDKIVPGMIVGALSFGHLPLIFVPPGPMRSGISHHDKAKARQQFALKEITGSEMLSIEMAAYPGTGTCNFYGTANSNEVILQFLGLELPGSSFFHPQSGMREVLTRAAARQILKITSLSDQYTPVGLAINEKAIVNAMVGLLATGGSSNHTIHLIAIAKAAGIKITWDDFSDLSSVTPLLAQIYPNGEDDVNRFHEAGGTAFVIQQLLYSGLLNHDVSTVAGCEGIQAYCRYPELEKGQLRWVKTSINSSDPSVLASIDHPFSPDGGLCLMRGNLGRGITKKSAIRSEHYLVEAPVRVFENQDSFTEAFKKGELDRDIVIVLRFQGPKTNGMPESHKLVPALSALQDRGRKVALVTDGRMSGASGKVPVVLHLSPEALDGGPLSKVQDGDMVKVDISEGQLQLLVPSDELNARNPAKADMTNCKQFGHGRELFEIFRNNVGDAETGATIF